MFDRGLQRPLITTMIAVAGVLGALVMATPARADGGPVRVLVQLAPGSDIATASAEQMAALGGTVTAGLEDVINGYAATVPGDSVATLTAWPGVQAVEPADAVVSAAATTQPTAPWQLDRLDQRALPLSSTYTYDTTGQGVDVYVLDTGISVGLPDFEGRARLGASFVPDEPADLAGSHGTAVAGLIGSATWGAAKSANLIGVKVLDANGLGTIGNIINGLQWVLDHKRAGVPAVVNLSNATPTNALYDDAVRALTDAGVTVVAAAGNSGEDACGNSPADVPAAITAGASDQNDARPVWSNYGPCVDLFAPGVAVASDALPGSGTDPLIDSGTSLAAPLVTGVAARYLQLHPTATPAQVSAALQADATYGVVANSRSDHDGLLHAGLTSVVSPFRAPVDLAPVRNSAQAGRTIPFAFTATDATGAPITGLTGSDVAPFTSLSSTCTSAPLDTIENYATAASRQLLDLGGGNYQYNLKSTKAWAGQCGSVGIKVLTTVRTSDFTFKP